MILMKFMKVYNGGLGWCHILDKKDKGFLVYSENNTQHFIVCSEISQEDCYFYNTEYFSTLGSAFDYFKKL